MSLGSSMAYDPSTQNTMVCGPTIPSDCASIATSNGLCFEIDSNNTLVKFYPPATEECGSQADIAFLLDGSGSVYTSDFLKMKAFVKNLIRTFLGKDTQFAITQFSSSPTTHYYFNTFSTSNWESQINKIRQLNGGTATAKAIQNVVDDVFSPQRGSRSNVKRILIVITDGECQDRQNLPAATQSAGRKNILRFVIGVGDAFTSDSAKQELRVIASQPAEDFVFQVGSFDALDRIRETLQAKIDSIEGYSMAVAKTLYGPLTILGAPRNQNKGFVMTVFNEQLRDEIRPFESQTGEYFGAEVCAMDVDSDGVTDLILISSPMYKDVDREGRVYVCELSHLNVVCYFDKPSQITTLRGDASVRGRFGSSLAVLPDINADTFNDLAVGAPLENDGQGSIYIFQGEGGRKINPTYSQRIAAPAVQSGLKSFGVSISQSSYDQSGDGLPDLAVGSKGKVVLLRSRPVVTVTATVSFNPNLIPTQNPDCSKKLLTKATVCFTMRKVSNVNQAQAQVNFTLTLDANRKIPNNRAEISKDVRHKSGSIHLNLNSEACADVDFFIESCPEDALNPLNNELRFTFDGLSSGSIPRPSLSPQVKTTTFHPIGFEFSCGADEVCEDNLMMDFNFTKSSVIKVGIDELLSVTVFVKNRGENSYNSRITLTYPVGLSYRKVTALERRIECNSVDSEDGVTKGKTVCSIDKPIFKSNSTAIFIVSYGFSPNSDLGRKIEVTANTISENKRHSPSSKVNKKQEIDVKYSVFVTIESSPSNTNFTFGENAVQKPLEQKIKVFNTIRPLNLTVVINVPVRFGDKDIWMDMNSFQIPGCQSSRDEEPTVTDFVNTIKEKTLDCTVAKCRVFRCSEFMERNEETTYTISANISPGWIEQIGLPSAKFFLTSTASLEYDENQYIFYSTTSNNDPPVHQIEAEVEVFSKPDFTRVIIRGSLGGLAFLALLTAGLYKAEFFKRNHNVMSENAGGEAGPEEAPLREG